jgi:hypothetical protein
MSQLLLRTSQSIFLGCLGDSRDSHTSFTALLASNLIAQFSRQIVIQILGLDFGVTKSLWGISEHVHFSLGLELLLYKSTVYKSAQSFMNPLKILF